MAIEKYWPEVPSLDLTQDGGRYGQLKIESTDGLKVKQRVFLASNVAPAQEFEIKSITSETDLILGPPGPEMEKTSDLTSFTVALSSRIFYPKKQPRPAIPPDAFNRAVFDEEPTVALRTSMVDSLGRKYTTQNPLPVQLSTGSVNVETLNANVQVQLSHRADDPNDGDVADSVRIGDGLNELNINPDGSINVTLQQEGTSDETVSAFNEASSVGSSTLTDVVSYVAEPGYTTFLSKVDYSGENIAKYILEIDGVVIDIQRTYFGSPLNGSFVFASGSKGLALADGEEVKLKVIHTRPTVGDFSGRIQVVRS